jgi:hypothetical protein
MDIVVVRHSRCSRCIIIIQERVWGCFEAFIDKGLTLLKFYI